MHRVAAKKNMLDRRSFITGAGAAGALVAINNGAAGWLLDTAGATSRRSFRLIRAEDQLIVTVDLLDARVSGATIVADGPNPGLRFSLGSQHTVEQAVDGEPAYPNPPTVGIGPADHRSAEGSRVVVDIATPIPFTLASMLDLQDKTPRLDGRSDTSFSNPPSLTTEPADDVTAIEIPTDLVISPSDTGRWLTDAVPQTIADVTEAWRVRLARLVNGQPVELPNTFGVGRAIYTAGDSTPALAIPQTSDREAIVALSANQTNPVDPITFLPIGRLWLSPAGGRFDTDVAFKPSTTYTVSAWAQRVVTGRDVFATIVRQGYIAPWGLPASVVEQTERQFVADSGNGITAAMVKLDYLVTVPQPTDTPAGAPNDGRDTPFPTMELGHMDMVPIGRGEVSPITTVQEAFWIKEPGGGDTLLQIPVTLTDHAGAKHKTSLAGIFVQELSAYGVGAASPAFQSVSAWNNRAVADRDMPMSGGCVAWAPERDPGSATRSTETIRMRAYHRADGGDPGASVPVFGPEVEVAWIIDEVAAGLSGVAGEAVQVVVNSDYLAAGDTNGSGSNPAGNFLDIATNFVVGSVTGDGGSMGAPSFNIQGLSQSFGTGPSLSSLTAWNPSVDLEGFGGKLLGVVELSDILPGSIDLIGDGVGQLDIPRIVPELPNPQIPEEICRRFEWSTELTSWGGVFISADDLTSVPGPTTMDLQAIACISTATGEPSAALDVRIQNFGIQLPPLLPALLITFNDLRYEQQAGQDADITVKMRDLEFVGILGWIQPIADLLGNISDNIGIDINFDGIVTEAKLPIPDINLGVMGVSDLEPQFGLELPFNGDPVAVSLAIGTQQAPFSIFVLSAGGSGYIEIDSTATEITRISAGLAVSFEWGVNVLVAKVSITGTIGGGIEWSNGQIEFTVFIAVRGTVAAFGLSAWLECRIDMGYNSGTELLSGQAKVSVGFDTPIGSQSVSFKLEQSIQLGDGVPNGMSMLRGGAAGLAGSSSASFVDQFSSNEWTEYCGAFA